jgi:hypothetical protein
VQYVSPESVLLPARPEWSPGPAYGIIYARQVPPTGPRPGLGQRENLEMW